MKIIAIGHTVAELLSLSRKYHENNAKIIAYTTKNFFDPMSKMVKNPEYEEDPIITAYSTVWLKNYFGINVMPAHKIMMVNGLKKSIRVQNISTKEIFEDSYDYLSIAKNLTSIRQLISD